MKLKVRVPAVVMPGVCDVPPKVDEFEIPECDIERDNDGNITAIYINMEEIQYV